MPWAAVNTQPFECHLKLQTKRGIWNMENLNLNQLVADKAYEFLFVWSPLATASSDQVGRGEILAPTATIAPVCA